MKKIKKILIGTNNAGKYREICALLPKEIIKFSPKEFKISTPYETGNSFEENSILKASYSRSAGFGSSKSVLITTIPCSPDNKFSKSDTVENKRINIGIFDISNVTFSNMMIL